MKEKSTMTRISAPLLKLAKFEALKEGVYLKEWLENAVKKALEIK